MSFLMLCFLLYFGPAVVASSRKHPAAVGIWITNFFVGWTGIGWIVCLVWALSVPRDTVFYPAMLYTGQTYAAPASWATYRGHSSGELICAVCHRPLAANSRFCSMCGATGTVTS